MIVVTNEVNVSICGPRHGLIYSNHYKMKLNYILFKGLECESGKKKSSGDQLHQGYLHIKEILENHNRKQYSRGGGDNKQYYCISINCI